MEQILVDALKQGRISKNLKQSDVAEMLGIKGNTLSNWETGRTEPDIDTFIKLCKIYELDHINLLYSAYGYLYGKKNKPTAECGKLTEEEQTLVHNYRELNEEGRQKLLETSDDLVATGKYTKNNPAQVPKQA